MHFSLFYVKSWHKSGLVCWGHFQVMSISFYFQFLIPHFYFFVFSLDIHALLRGSPERRHLCTLLSIQYCMCEVDGIPPIGIVCRLSVLSGIVFPVVSSMNSSTKWGFILCLLARASSVGLLEGVASSLPLLGFLSSLRGVCRTVGLLMIYWGGANSSKISGCYDSSRCPECSTWSDAFCCSGGWVLGSCDLFGDEVSPGTCAKKFSSIHFSKSTHTLSTSTHVLS